MAQCRLLSKGLHTKLAILQIKKHKVHTLQAHPTNTLRAHHNSGGDDAAILQCSCWLAWCPGFLAIDSILSYVHVHEPSKDQEEAVQVGYVAGFELSLSVCLACRSHWIGCRHH